MSTGAYPPQVLEGMRGQIACKFLAACSRSVGERAWLLPSRLHPLVRPSLLCAPTLPGLTWMQSL